MQPGAVDVLRGGALTISGAPAGSQLLLDGKSYPIAAADDGKWQVTLPPFAHSGQSEIAVLAPDGRRWASKNFAVQLKDRELAYPLLMGKFLPVGLLGLVIASLLAAFMSTIDTHTNWGASYLVQDIYLRFIRPDADERRAVLVSRLAIVFMALLAGVAASFIDSIASVWRFLVILGAGLGSVSAARWYWSRVTAWAEFAAMGVSTLLALALQFFFTETLFGSHNPLFLFKISGWQQILLIAAASLATWIPVSLWGPREDEATLRSFAQKVRPAGPGWRRYRASASDPVRPMLLRFLAGGVAVYGALFGLGDLFVGSAARGLFLCALAALALAWIIRSGRGTAATGEKP